MRHVLILVSLLSGCAATSGAGSYVVDGRAILVKAQEVEPRMFDLTAWPNEFTLASNRDLGVQSSYRGAIDRMARDLCDGPYALVVFTEDALGLGTYYPSARIRCMS